MISTVSFSLQAIGPIVDAVTVRVPQSGADRSSKKNVCTSACGSSRMLCIERILPVNVITLVVLQISGFDGSSALTIVRGHRTATKAMAAPACIAAPVRRVRTRIPISSISGRTITCSFLRGSEVCWLGPAL